MVPLGMGAVRPSARSTVRPSAMGDSIAACRAHAPPEKGFMIRLLSLLTLAAPLLLLAVPGRAAEANVHANIGLTLIELPVPAGYAEASRVLPQMRQLGERMTPRTNRLLAICLSTEDVALARAGQPPAMARYFMAQTLRQAESVAIPEAEFGHIKSLLREQYKRLLSSVGASASVQAQLDGVVRDFGRDAGVEALSLKIGELKGLEVFDESAASISLLAATRFMVQDGERTQEVPMAMGITTATLKGKLVYFYAYSVYRSADDLEWVRSVTRQWLPLAMGAN